MATNIETSGQRRFLEIETNGSAVEAVGGLGVIILSILGLAGAEPIFLAPCAGVIFGAALFAQGAYIGAENATLVSKVSGGAFSGFDLAGGIGVEFLAGGAAIALGILALVGRSPEFLLPALVIAAGAGLILSTGTIQRQSGLKLEAAGAPEIAQRVVNNSVTSIASAQFLAGLAAIVLGIIAFVPTRPGLSAVQTAPGASWMTLTLVALLILGATITLTGAALAGRMSQMFNRTSQ